MKLKNVKSTIINTIIFFGPLFLTNIEQIKSLLSHYLDANIVAVIVSVILHIIKKINETSPNG